MLRTVDLMNDTDVQKTEDGYAYSFRESTNGKEKLGYYVAAKDQYGYQYVFTPEYIGSGEEEETVFTYGGNSKISDKDGNELKVFYLNDVVDYYAA